MTDLSKLFAAVESDEFAAVAGLASGPKLFLRNLHRMSEFNDLLAAVGDGDACEAVAERIVSLTRQEIDGRYLRPCDTAVAAYLYLLSMKNDRQAQAVAGMVIPAGGWWWAQLVAEKAWG